jgi:hypothetical protein
VKGIAGQLGPTSKMAWENRMALDMILAERGEEYMFWLGWMLHIHPQQHSFRWTKNSPDSPDKQLAKNSGINDPLTNWLEQ